MCLIVSALLCWCFDDGFLFDVVLIVWFWVLVVAIMFAVLDTAWRRLRFGFVVCL